MGLLVTTIIALAGWYTEYNRADSLQKTVIELQYKDKRSAVLRSVSRQMEEIAYQQIEISDEQRLKAEHQTMVAEEMRQRSEVERQNALAAQQMAMESERQAQDARLVAENQRQMAEHQRLQAELSKRVADTLSYVTLGRSLGSLSIVKSSLGNTELAAQLSYAAYHFTSQYNGDIFYPTVLQALMKSSRGINSWTKHKGTVTALDFMPGEGKRVVTASSYGELMIHTRQGGQLLSTTLLADSQYDFRGLFIDNSGVIYAVSRSGHLVVVEGGEHRVLTLETLHNPMWVKPLNDSTLLLAGDNGLAFYDVKKKHLIATRSLDYSLTAVSRYKDRPLLFDNKGRQHLVSSINELQTTNVPVKGTVTAFVWSRKTRQQAFGMKDGNIYIYDEMTGKVVELAGHLSRITKLRLVNNRLLSSSYDRTVNLWNTNSAKIEPTSILKSESWITCLDIDPSGQYVWIGNQNGDVKEVLFSVPVMVSDTYKQLKRDFTTEEWNYYIGKKIPYESFLHGNSQQTAVKQ